MYLRGVMVISDGEYPVVTSPHTGQRGALLNVNVEYFVFKEICYRLLPGKNALKFL